MMFEKGHNRRRSTTHELPPLSVARNLTVSLHRVARASSPVTQRPEPGAIHPTNRPPSVLAVCPSTAPTHATFYMADSDARVLFAWHECADAAKAGVRDAEVIGEG